jgi:hypothetical protein
MHFEPKTIGELFPAFAAELQELTERLGRSDIAEQLRDLPVLSRCTCAQRNCAHFYTAAPPLGSYPTGHSNLLVPATSGLVVLDVVDSRVVAVEVLDRFDVKSVLDQYLPLKR